MINAKQEFLEHIADKPLIICAQLWTDKCLYPIDCDEDKAGLKVNLHLNFTDQEYEYFIKNINFDYDSGYGSQELFGKIWYEDGTWSSRFEYDGSEWWEHCKCPEIPEELLSIERIK